MVSFKTVTVGLLGRMRVPRLSPDKRDCKLVRILVRVVGPFARTSCMRLPFFLRSKPPGITCMLKSEGFTPRRPLVGYSISKSLDNSFEFRELDLD